jgi:hypothetical protein
MLQQILEVYKHDATHAGIAQVIFLLASHCSSPSLIPGQVIWDLWWTKWP